MNDFGCLFTRSALHYAAARCSHERYDAVERRAAATVFVLAAVVVATSDEHCDSLTVGPTIPGSADAFDTHRAATISSHRPSSASRSDPSSTYAYEPTQPSAASQFGPFAVFSPGIMEQERVWMAQQSIQWA